MPSTATQPSLFYRVSRSADATAASRDGALTAAPRAMNQRERIYHWLRAHGPATYREIADAREIPLSSVCGRMNELQAAGRVQSVGTVPGPYGAKNAKWRAI